MKKKFKLSPEAFDELALVIVALAFIGGLWLAASLICWIADGTTVRLFIALLIALCYVALRAGFLNHEELQTARATLLHYINVIGAKESTIGELELELDDKRLALERINEQYSAAATDIQVAEDRIEELTAIADRLGKELDDVKAQAAADIEALRTSRAEYREAADDLGEELKELTQDRDQWKQLAEAAADEIATLRVEAVGTEASEVVITEKSEG